MEVNSQLQAPAVLLPGNDSKVGISIQSGSGGKEKNFCCGGNTISCILFNI
jgi:hypothetical protein